MQVKHSHCGTRTHGSWKNMKQRVLNPNRPDYHHYGGRGITVCTRWKESFAAFFEDMGECPKGMSIDRIDNEGNYCPENCRWATHSQQVNNTTKTIYCTYKEKTLSVSQWCKILNKDASVVRGRLRLGHSFEKAMFTPLRKKIGDITGKVFGQWTVIKRSCTKEWFCRCSCGTMKLVSGSHLKSGKSTRCRPCVGKKDYRE